MLRAWLEGRFELVLSPLLLRELERALAYPKLRRHITAEEAEQFAAWLARSTTVADDPTDPPALRASDPDDDYLLALAAAESAALVTGDAHLLELAAVDRPIHSPASFLSMLD